MTSEYPGDIDSFSRPTHDTAMNATDYEHADLHNKIADAVVALQTTLGVNPAGSSTTVAIELAGKASAGHTHTIAQIPNLQSTLDGKASSSHSHSWAQVTNKPSVFAPDSHTHVIGDVVGLQALIDSKSGVATSGTPEALGAASRGSSSDAARADHVHPLPTLVDLGAASRTISISAGSGLSGGGSLSSSRTLSVVYGGTGSSTSVARSDHDHDADYSQVIPLPSSSPLPDAHDYPVGTVIAVY